MAKVKLGLATVQIKDDGFISVYDATIKTAEKSLNLLKTLIHVLHAEIKRINSDNLALVMKDIHARRKIKQLESENIELRKQLNETIKSEV